MIYKQNILFLMQLLQRDFMAACLMLTWNCFCLNCWSHEVTIFEAQSLLLSVLIALWLFLIHEVPNIKFILKRFFNIYKFPPGLLFKEHSNFIKHIKFGSKYADCFMTLGFDVVMMKINHPLTLAEPLGNSASVEENAKILKAQK